MNEKNMMLNESEASKPPLEEASAEASQKSLESAAEPIGPDLTNPPAKTDKSAVLKKQNLRKRLPARSPHQISIEMLSKAGKIAALALLLLTALRVCLAELRYIPSSSMEPNLLVEDRIIVEKVSGWLMRPIERGDVLVFYPPSIESDKSNDGESSLLSLLGRISGLPCFPEETAYVKRVVGLPGEKIKIKKGVGVFINDQLLPEPYTKESPDYEINVLGDIGGRNAAGELIKPYDDSCEPVLVPPGKLFMLGDNRNMSQDSHVWGFVDQKKVVGKSCLLFWRLLKEKSCAH